MLLPDTSLLRRSVALQEYDTYVEEAYLNDPAMQLLRKQTEIAKNEVRLTKAEALPSISLYASNTLARPVSRTMADMYNNAWNFGLSVSYPLSSLYKNNHRVKESKFAVQMNLNAEEQKKQQVRVTVRTAFLRHREALRQAPGRCLEAFRAPGGRELSHYAEPVSEPAGDTDRPAGCQCGEAERGTATYIGTHAGHLYLFSTGKSLRKIVIYTYFQLERACGRL